MELDKEFRLFKSWVLTNKVELEFEGYNNLYIPWKYYDYSPKEEEEEGKEEEKEEESTEEEEKKEKEKEKKKKPAPLVIITSVSIDIFFRQFVELCPKGYRIIAAEVSGIVVDSYPVWVKSFHTLLTQRLHVQQAHILGFQLGGILAQLYATRFPKNVGSLIFLNGFCNNKYFTERLSTLSKMTFSIAPMFLLRSNMLIGLPKDNLPVPVAESFDFVATCVERMSRSEISTLLSLTYAVPVEAEPQAAMKGKVMIITVADDEPFCSYPASVREEIKKFYPDAQVAELRRGCGEFPQLTVSDEVNMYIQVHLRKFQSQN